MEPGTAARRWRDTWLRAWREQDVESIRALYADYAVFRSHPFRDVHEGAEGVEYYFPWAFADEEVPADVWFGEPWVADDRATCEWWAVVRYEGRDVTLAGVAVLRFGDDGRVATQRDYWAQQDGRLEPPSDWGS